PGGGLVEGLEELEARIGPREELVDLLRHLLAERGVQRFPGHDPQVDHVIPEALAGLSLVVEHLGQPLGREDAASDQDLAQGVRAAHAADEPDSAGEELDDLLLGSLGDREHAVALRAGEHLEEVGDAEDVEIAADPPHGFILMGALYTYLMYSAISNGGLILSMSAMGIVGGAGPLDGHHR